LVQQADQSCFGYRFPQERIDVRLGFRLHRPFNLPI
jgi:hypothetical protein